jgi:acyl-coenzyme A thioesterase PaaI-like protein
MLSQPSVTLDALNALLAAHEFTRKPGFRVTGLGAGECELAAPYSPEYERPGGIVSGQLYMHAADVAFWLAIKTRLGLEDGSVTSGMTTAFLGSARREGFSCRARLLRVGQRLIYGEAECSAGGRLLTHHTLTYARPATSLAAATTSS